MESNSVEGSGHGDVGQASRTSWPERLPKEIILKILENLGAVDARNFIVTCRTFGFNFCNDILVNDIKTRVYNSLAWACYSGDATLALQCLRFGASPNAVFLHPKSARDQMEHYQQERLKVAFEFPVFPTISTYKKDLPDVNFTSCALHIATRENHIGVMKALLGFRDNQLDKSVETADVVQRRSNTYMDEVDLQLDRQCTGHPVALTHARTAEAVRLLLAAGEAQGDTHINDTGGTLATVKPLNAIMLSYNEEVAPTSLLRDPIPDDELEAIAKLLIGSGAHTRRVRAEILTSDSRSPLQDAIVAGLPSVIAPIIRGGPWNTVEVRHECFLAYSMVLDNERDEMMQIQIRPTRRPRKAPYDKMLAAFMEAGVSPNDDLPDRRRPMKLVMIQHSVELLKVLLEYKADPNLTDINNLSPLALSMFATKHPSGVSRTQDLITELLASGANINQPSLHPMGFTPLMFATGDAVKPPIFDRLIRDGANRGHIGRLSSSGPILSVLQCLLLGFPFPNPETYRKDKLTFDRHELKRLLRPPTGYGSCQIILESPDSHRIRTRKFRSFIATEILREWFYTATRRHVLNWVIDKFFGSDLPWAVKLLARHYENSKVVKDKETPLAVFFSPHRINGYLKFGTLDNQYQAVEAMLNSGLAELESGKLQDILIRVCQLSPTFSDVEDAEAWERVRDMSRCNLDFSQQFVEKMFKLRPRRVRNPGLYAQFIRQDPRYQPTFPVFAPLLFNVRLQEVSEVKEAYKKHRGRNIAKIIMLFLEKGVDFYAEGPDGETACSHAMRHGTLQYVEEQWRNLKKEKQIRSRLDVFTQVAAVAENIEAIQVSNNSEAQAANINDTRTTDQAGNDYKHEFTLWDKTWILHFGDRQYTNLFTRFWQADELEPEPLD
ncbi:hypothetical protein B0T10DRAFT_577104 [Thelonectria olida]|uniref:Ankyrin n=1 Tax=Thelonectria olida TaxID=1576542 RepID=A0A9P8VZW9_9HYPO|nr:hypothetical protein B0T10DRAFT_577104 [Thelonectria olida]